MIIFNKITKTEAYVELTTENGEKHIIPTSDVIFVNDESGFVSIKNTGSRKTIGLISEEEYDRNPDEPEHYKVWGYLTDGSVYVIQEDGGSVLNNIELGPYRTTMATANIGTGVTEIGTYAFYKCSSLTSITIPNSVTKWMGYDLNNMFVDIHIDDLKTWINLDGAPTRQFIQGSKIYVKGVPVEGTVIIPNGITEVKGFQYYKYITEAVLPNSVTSIGNVAFMAASSFSKINIPNGVTNIGDFAFYVSQLSSITIPDSVTSIGAHALRDINIKEIIFPKNVVSIGEAVCLNDKLNYVIIEPIIPPTLGKSAFIPWTFPIYVPDASVDAYKAAPNWSDYADRIKPMSEYQE